MTDVKVMVIEVDEWDTVTCQCRALIPLGAPMCLRCSAIVTWAPRFTGLLRPNGERSVVVYTLPNEVVIVVGDGWEGATDGASAEMIAAVRAQLSEGSRRLLAAQLGVSHEAPPEVNAGVGLPTWVPKVLALGGMAVVLVDYLASAVEILPT